MLPVIKKQKWINIYYNKPNTIIPTFRKDLKNYIFVFFLYHDKTNVIKQIKKENNTIQMISVKIRREF